jgi:UDP-glucose:(heptosyl)LPS alpha-1,3-glucosyltransferase
MRVALIHMRHAATGGTERYLNHLAAHLARRGDEVSIVCRSHEEAPHPGIRFEVLRPLAVGAAMRMTSFARAAERHVRERPYDVVYGLGKTWTHDVIRLGGGCHQTYLERTGTAVRHKERLALGIESRALAPDAYLRVVVNARMVAEDVGRRHGVPADRIALIYNGVDLERFHPRKHAGPGAQLRRSIGVSDREIAVLFLGSGYARKGLDLLIEAFAAVSRQRAEARLVVVGRDSDEDRYRRAAAAAGIAENTRFLGPRADAESCFAAADLYVLPTRYDPFANTTLEALASGLPVITSRDNGASELIEEGRNGSVLPELDPATLASTLLGWCDPDRFTEAAAAARELAERHPIATACASSAALLDSVAGLRSERTGVRV